MKYILLLLSAAFLGAAALQTETTLLSGVIRSVAGEPLAGATIQVLQGTTLIKGAITDAEGKYKLELEPGAYDVQVSYPGYIAQRTTGIVLRAGAPTTFDASLTPSGSTLDEVVVVGYSARNERVLSKTKTSAMTAAPESKPAPYTALKSAAGSKAKTDAVKPKPARKEMSKGEAEPMVKAAEVESPRDVLEDRVVREEAASMDADKKERAEAPAATPPGGPKVPSPRAGLLTAGEWNDLHNWSRHWLDLLADGEIESYQNTYHFFPKNRYSVLLQNENGFPITDAAVQLLGKGGELVWEARTDNTGHAELWDGMFAKSDARNLKLRAWVDGKKNDLGEAKPFAAGLNQHQIKRECQASKNVDIVWAVDATGSMGDEIEYLKTELLDVIGRAKAINPDLALRMGSVFYRDQGDDYLVKGSALNYDVAKTVDYIRKQYAGGGGDYPEAVHSALEEAIFRQPWSEQAIARICFLVLDASPHQQADVIESLQKSIREAARRGIRIVPVSASGIQKDTEFLMKFFGLATNGSYVFLTDHSGIGGKHLEPTTDEYKVELLNDLLVRLITEYTSVETCEGKSSIRFDDPNVQPGQDQPGQSHPQALYYPNPASSFFTLELPFEADKVTLYDAEGKAVRTFAKLAAGTHTVPVNDLAEGFYTLRIWKDKQVQSGKVVVVRA